MLKEIERYGIPIVHMATITTISQSVGANRIVPTVAIPHPVGNPKLSSKDEKSLKHILVKKAIDALSTEVSGITQFE
ncbi:glycine reductase [Hathewaya limosa]|nr:glycine reductase [Hathewaya limosa]